MKTLKLFSNVLLTIPVVAFLFTSCDNSDIISIDNPLEIASRSCNVISQSWLDELKTIAAEEFSSSSGEIEVSAIEKFTETSYTIHSQSALVGRPVNDITKFLILVTKDGYEGNIFGYHDPTSLTFCTMPASSNVMYGTVESIVYTTLGILGVDEDNF